MGVLFNQNSIDANISNKFFVEQYAPLKNDSVDSINQMFKPNQD